MAGHPVTVRTEGHTDQSESATDALNKHVKRSARGTTPDASFTSRWIFGRVPVGQVNLYSLYIQKTTMEGEDH